MAYCEVKTLKIKEFIQGRNVSYDTVRKYIVNNENLFKGHAGRTNNIVLDDEAIAILDKKYPFPEPIQIVEDTEARRQLIEAQQKIIELQQQLIIAAPKIAKAENTEFLLELVENEASDLRANKKILESELKELTEEKHEQELQFQKEKEELLRQLEAEKSKSCWDKLRGK